jgi:hypothetical protein
LVSGHFDKSNLMNIAIFMAAAAGAGLIAASPDLLPVLPVAAVASVVAAAVVIGARQPPVVTE